MNSPIAGGVSWAVLRLAGAGSEPVAGGVSWAMSCVPLTIVLWISFVRSLRKRGSRDETKCRNQNYE